MNQALRGIVAVAGGPQLCRTHRRSPAAASRRAVPAKREGTSEQQRPRLRVEARANNYRAYTAFTTQAPRPEADDSGVCAEPYVECVNPADGGPSQLTIEVPDFPGLLRLIAWCINGLDCKVLRAKLAMKDGIAISKFAVTDLRGQQVEDTKMFADRMTELITRCLDMEKEVREETIFTAGHVTVDNSGPATVVILKADTSKNSALLEVASILNGLNFNVEEADLCNDCEGPIGVGPATWKFKITRKGKKLDAQQADSLCFAIFMATGKNTTLMEMPI